MEQVLSRVSDSDERAKITTVFKDAGFELPKEKKKEAPNEMKTLVKC